MGEDPLSSAHILKLGASTSKWDAADYARVGSFVSELGAAALDLLDPQPGERILDIGCGDGALTRRIAERGARVVGVDSSPEMVAAAVAAGIDARLVEAAEMPFAAEFDAAFSNAALHWMLDREAVAAAIFGALKPGARFAGEMGGEGNIAILRGAIRAELCERGYPVPAQDPQWYPSRQEFQRVYGAAGFVDIDARIIPRETHLASGIAEWVKTFRAGWLDAAQVPEADRDAVAAAVERRLELRLRRPDGSWFADYVRLRFIMRKPS
ncbi:MAG TPA: methyltransferase domain-containing protein [Sphingomicrobium sp.]|nr:methyltransferase domain-containing protein [Sphingomicrobium sp.]